MTFSEQPRFSGSKQRDSPYPKRFKMPRIIISTADGEMTLMEDILMCHLQSQHYANNLLERVVWALKDAEEHENHKSRSNRRSSNRNSLRLNRRNERVGSYAS